MPTETYTLISQTTLAAATSTVTFGSLPQTYRDLVLVIATTGDGFLLPTVNNDSGSNYSRVLLAGNGSTAISAAGTSITSIDIGQPVDATVRSFIIQFMDYSATDKHKTVLARANGTTGSGGGAGTALAGAYRWANTAAITTITVPISGYYNSGSTFALYGIAS